MVPSGDGVDRRRRFAHVDNLTVIVGHEKFPRDERRGVVSLGAADGNGRRAEWTALHRGPVT